MFALSPHKIGVCRECHYGELVFVMDSDTGDICVTCDECLCRFSTPEDALANTNECEEDFIDWGRTRHTGLAGIHEIEKAGWTDYIKAYYSNSDLH
jgi:hypothetical protein